MITIDFLRAKVGDVNLDNPKLTDKQYEQVLSMENNYYRAASICAEMIAALYVGKKKVNLRGISVENQQVFDHYMRMAQLYSNKVSLGLGYIGDDGSNISNSASPVVSGVDIDEVKEVKRDSKKVKGVFPKPTSDVE